MNINKRQLQGETGQGEKKHSERKKKEKQYIIDNHYLHDHITKKIDE